MHSRVLLATTGLALLLGSPAFSQAPAPVEDGTVVAQDTTAQPDQNAAPAEGQAATASTPQEFATMAAHSNLFEIESSRLAVEKAQQDATREFAQRMVDDHTRASEEMMTAAEADGVSDVPQTLDSRHQEMMTQLQDAPADQFDSLYLQMQLAAHEEAVALFSSFAEQEGALADFAEATLPTLEEHRDMVRELAQ